MALLLDKARTIHVRLDGRSYDLPADRLGIDETWTDNQIKARIASHLEVPVDRLIGSVIDRHPNGNLTIRPEAVFG
jgi:hypothetical protein